MKIILISFLLFLTSCGASNNSPNAESTSNGNSNTNISANNATPTVSKRDPQKFCYLQDFVGGEYKQSGSGGFSCLNTKNGTLPSGRFQSYSYGAYGDAQNVETVRLMMLSNSKHQDAAAGEEVFVKTSEELWQRVFAAPLPNDIREAILTNTGKNVEVRKTFTEPTNATVSRRPGGGTTYTLSLDVTLPK